MGRTQQKTLGGSEESSAAERAVWKRLRNRRWRQSQAQEKDGEERFEVTDQ